MRANIQHDNKKCSSNPSSDIFQTDSSLGLLHGVIHTHPQWDLFYLPIYILGNYQLLFSSLWSDARDLLSKNLDEFSSERHGHTEMGRGWKVFQSIPYHSSAAESVQVTPSNTNSPGKLLQSTPKSDQSCFIFCRQTISSNSPMCTDTSCSLAVVPTHTHTSALSHSPQILPVFPGSVHGPPDSMVLSICIIAYCPNHINHYLPLWESFLHQQKLLKSKKLKGFFFLVSFIIAFFKLFLQQCTLEKRLCIATLTNTHS